MSPSGGSRRCSILRKFQWPRHVRFGSKADISQCSHHVGFAPESGHSETTFHGGVDKAWGNKRHRDRHIDVTNTATVALSDDGVTT
jgi:hypothetical protein